MAISDDAMSGGPIGGSAESPSSSGNSYPYLIQAGVTLKIANVSVEINTPISGTGPKIRGTQADGFNVPETALSLVSGNVYQAANIDVTAAFAANLTAFYDTFDIVWEVSADGTTWDGVGTSTNPIYVCLADPTSSPVTMFRTVVHLACSNAGAIDVHSAVDNTWALFSTLGGSPGPKNVQTWDERYLYYYIPGSTFDLQKNPLTVAGLLKVGSGECVAWAHMLQDAWTINGVTSDYNIATAQPTAFFFVNDWTSLGSIFYFQSLAQDMIPYPAGGTQPNGYYSDGVTTEFKNEPTVSGQNSGSDAPSQKVFANHQFLKYNGLYYDPSYGVTYTGQASFASNAVAGYGIFNAIISGKRTLTFSTSGSIAFSV